MSIFRKCRPDQPDVCREVEKESRLIAAESRANSLFERAEWLQAAVLRRDRENHWQESVNRLFLGGQT